MTEQEIIEGNKMIAQFMGFNFLEDGSVNVQSKTPIYLTNWKKLDFDNDWDWLYPVIIKIRRVSSGMGVVTDIPAIAPYRFGIEYCFRKCIEFILYYNKENGSDVYVAYDTKHRKNNF
jgi:hypothetical protein